MFWFHLPLFSPHSENPIGILFPGNIKRTFLNSQVPRSISLDTPVSQCRMSTTTTSRVPAAVPGSEQLLQERPRRDTSPDKRARDLSPDKRAKNQTLASDEEVSRLLKRAPRDASPDKKLKLLSLVSDEEVSSVFRTLTVYTLLIIFIPIVTYFTARKYIFEDFLGYTSRESFIYWAVLAVASIHVVLFIMVYRAYTEGLKPRTLKQD